jgi:hypothetical protein
MPNFKIFQDNPDQVRIKIYGGNNTAFNTDSSGNLSITSTGLAITAPANGLTVTAPSGGLSITPPTNGLAITSTGLAITAPANGLTVTAPSSGLSITPPTDGLLITSAGLAVQSTLATTDVSAVRPNFTNTAGSPDTTYNVLSLSEYTFGLVNSSLAANAQAVAKLQVSPDATSWVDNTSYVTLNVGDVTGLVSTVFLKYARVYYAAVNAASAVTLNIFFQGHS